ncbi:hypothetical protein GC176_17250 [bacterium]|nr:hypothetical protein [bacterium]
MMIVPGTAFSAGNRVVSAPPSQRPVSSADLRPKEHGAYAILGVPLVTALIITGFHSTGVLIAVAAAAGFFAHEPLMILIGQRGRRARSDTPQATRILLTRLMIALACGVLAFGQGSAAVRYWLAASLIVAAIEFVLLTVGRSRALITQLVGIAGLTLPAAAVVAVGNSQTTALQFWLIWVIGRMATTTAVRAAVAHHRQSTARRALWGCDSLLALTFAAAGSGLTFGSPAWLVGLPLLIAAAALRLATPHPKHLKRVGWGLLTVNVAAGLLMVFLHTA